MAEDASSPNKMTKRIVGYNMEFGKICRICLALDNLVPLEKNEKGDGKLEPTQQGLRFTYVTGIKVVKDDPFPKWVCKKCADKLAAFMSFLGLSRKSQRQFEKKFIGNLKKMGCPADQIKEIVADRCVKQWEKLKMPKELKWKETAVVDVLDDSDDEVEEKREKKSPGDWKCPDCHILLSHAHAIYHMDCHKYDAHSKVPKTCRYCYLYLNGVRWEDHLVTEHDVKTIEPSPSIFVCKVCLAPLLTESRLRRHYESSHSQDLDCIAVSEGYKIGWVCKDCDIRFNEEKSYVMHCAQTHGEVVTEKNKILWLETDTCTQCGYIKCSPLEDAIHELFMHDQEDTDSAILCPACHGQCRNHDALVEHLVKHHYFLFVHLQSSCIFCDSTFDDFLTAKFHLKHVHGLPLKIVQQKRKKPEKEPLPEISVGHVFEIDAESNCVVEIPNAIACLNCTSCFESQEELQEHNCIKPKKRKRAVNNPEPSPCPLCKKVFSSRFNLHQHFRRSHSQAKRPCVKNIKCPECPKKFSRQNGLENHIDMAHRGIRPYECGDCSATFFSQQSLRKHLYLHLPKEERPMFHCEVCGRSYRSHSGYARHCLLHEGVKNHRCEFCDKSFYTSHELKQHTKYHTNELDYTCAFCGRKCLTPTQLKSHINTTHFQNKQPRQKQTRKKKSES